MQSVRRKKQYFCRALFINRFQNILIKSKKISIVLVTKCHNTPAASEGLYDVLFLSFTRNLCSLPLFELNWFKYQMQCYLSGMVKHCDSFVNPVCDIREGLNLKNKISIRLNLGGGSLPCTLSVCWNSRGKPTNGPYWQNMAMGPLYWN